MAKAAKPVTPRDKDDDYLECKEYHGHKVTDERNNVAFFSHANNKEYFAARFLFALKVLILSPNAALN